MATPDQQTPVADGDITGTVVEAIDSFDAMGLSEPLLRGIYAYGFEKPSALAGARSRTGARCCGSLWLPPIGTFQLRLDP
jgi:hypothetical protein